MASANGNADSRGARVSATVVSTDPVRRIASGKQRFLRCSMTRQLTAVIEREGDGYVAFCPEVDVASQGDTVSEAQSNLREALELFFETASPQEVEQRMHGEVY